MVAPAIAILSKFAGRREHDKRQVDIAEHGQLIRLLDKSIPSLGVRDLSVGWILYLLNLQLNPPHRKLTALSQNPSAFLATRNTARQTDTKIEQNRLRSRTHYSLNLDRSGVDMKKEPHLMIEASFAAAHLPAIHSSTEPNRT